MPYTLRKVRNKSCYRVVNKKTGQVKARCATRKNAEKQMRLLRALEHNPGFRKSFRRRSGGGGDEEEDKIKEILGLQRSLFLESKPDVLLFTINIGEEEVIQKLGRLEFKRFVFVDPDDKTSFQKDGYNLELYDDEGNIEQFSMFKEERFNALLNGKKILWKNITVSTPTGNFQSLLKNFTLESKPYLEYYYKNMYSEGDVSHQHQHKTWWGSSSKQLRTKTYCTDNNFNVLHRSRSGRCFSLNTQPVECYGPDIYNVGVNLTHHLYEHGQKAPNPFKNCKRY